MIRKINRIFDTHAHFDDETFDADRKELLTQLFDTQIDTIVNVGASLDGCRASVALAREYEQMYAAVGVHPDDTPNLTMAFIDWMKQEARSNPKVVAIGEIGLDYHYPEPEKDVQKKWFRKQLQAAAEVDKPVIIHSREACQDTIQILQEEHAEKVGGIIHCYSYTKESVPTFLKMNFYFGIGGVVTFKNAKKLVEAVEVIPMDKIVLETDCPYLSPEPNRGKRNHSGNIPYIVKKISEIKGLPEEEVIRITHENARTVFRMNS